MCLVTCSGNICREEREKTQTYGVILLTAYEYVDAIEDGFPSSMPGCYSEGWQWLWLRKLWNLQAHKNVWMMLVGVTYICRNICLTSQSSERDSTCSWNTCLLQRFSC